MNFINELHDGDVVKSVYLCKMKKTCQKPTGKSYYSLTLQDKTGTIDARVWNLTSGINNFNEMDYINVKGKVVLFQNSLQLHIDQIRKCDEGEYIPADYVPVSDNDVAGMYEEFLSYIAGMKNTYLKQLVESFFIQDKNIKNAFSSHSAAKNIHHSFYGGLLEHTLSVVKICDLMATTYPMVNRDLLIAGAMFHDIGKIVELSAFPENDYTDDGQLLGHLIIGVEMVTERINQIPGFPHKLASELKHIIIAHNGTLEYGSPKVPSTLEALALSLADNMDARMQTMSEALKEADDKLEWIGYNRLFETNIRRSTKATV